MAVLDRRMMRDEKIEKLKEGRTVYAENDELIRLIKRGIDREKLIVKIEENNGGCWFTPVEA